MKRIFIFFALVLVFIAIGNNQKIELFNVNRIKTYTNEKFYQIENAAKYQKDGYIVFECDYSYLNDTLNLAGECYCVEFTYQSLDIDLLLKEYCAKIIKIDVLEDQIIYYLFSKKFQNHINLYDQSFNMQVSLSKEEMKIGIPTLIGSY